MFNKYNTVEIVRDHYKSDSDYWNAITDLIRVLSEADYICATRLEDCGVFVVEYNYAKAELSGITLEWVDHEKEDVFPLNNKDAKDE